MLSNKFTPLSRVVNAALTDTYADAGVGQHRYSHWAARGLRKLVTERLSLPIRRALLPVNRNTMTATLPIGFENEIFVGFIEKGARVPLPYNRNLINIESVECEGSANCQACGQEAFDASDIEPQMDVEIVTIGGVDFEQITIKTIIASGNIVIDRKVPFLNTDTSQVEFRETRDVELLAKKSCGCIDWDVSKNAVRGISSDLCDCYCSKRTSSCSRSRGSYKILEDAGLIQLDEDFTSDRLYIEYTSFISKVNGEYMVPSIAFETLVNWSKFKAVENNKSVPVYERKWYLDRYKEERGNMNKSLGKVKLSSIVSIASRLPKFDITN